MTLEQQLKTKAQTKMLENHQAQMKRTLEEYVEAQEEVRDSVAKMNELRTTLYYMEKQQDSITDDLLKELNAQEDSGWEIEDLVKLREIFTAYDTLQEESNQSRKSGEDKINSELSYVPTMATMIPMVKMLGTLDKLYLPHFKKALNKLYRIRYRGSFSNSSNNFPAMVEDLRKVLFDYNNFNHFMQETAEDLTEENISEYKDIPRDYNGKPDTRRVRTA